MVHLAALKAQSAKAKNNLPEEDALVLSGSDGDFFRT
jgi:hypothetical protein